MSLYTNGDQNRFLICVNSKTLFYFLDMKNKYIGLILHKKSIDFHKFHVSRENAKFISVTKWVGSHIENLKVSFLFSWNLPVDINIPLSTTGIST